MSQLIDNLNLIVSIKSDIKSAIENKGVDMTGVSFPGYASKIGEISGGGGSAVIEGLTITSNGTYTAREGVDGYSPIEVNVPIDGWDQKSVTEGMIKIINLDNSASFVASSAFTYNMNIQTVNLPYATSVGGDAFKECTSLTQVSLPMCSLIRREAFRGCKSLLQVSLPVCSYIDIGALSYCRSLSQVSLPVCSDIKNWALGDCYSLSQVSLPVCSHIGDYAFWGCSSLSRITIGYSSVCSLNNSNVFEYTQITSSTGSIYVPVSLVDAYKSAKNWSYFSTQIFPIE